MSTDQKHIVIDARRMSTSTGHHIKQLVDQAQILDQKNQYMVILLEKEKDFYIPTNKNFRVITTKADFYTFSEQVSLAYLLYRLKPDLVHFWMPQQPLLWFGKRITTVHDTTLIRYENIDQNIVIYRIRKLIFTLLLRNVIFRSQFILSPTNFVRNDLDEWTGHRYSKKLLATPIAADFIDTPPEEIGELAGKDFLFWIGNAFPYKNVDKIVKGFAIAKKKHPNLHLALAGKRDIFYEKIEQLVKSQDIPDVHILGYIKDEERLWAMQNARAYVVASLSEGFHMPLHEAMHEGCPVISSNATCLPEVGGDGPLYFDPNDVEQLAENIDELLGNATLRNDMIQKGYAQIKHFSWDKAGKQTYDAYRRVLGF